MGRETDVLYDVAVMHYIEGYKVGEIAEVTGQSEAAVKKQLQRGREELKRRITR